MRLDDRQIIAWKVKCALLCRIEGWSPIHSGGSRRHCNQFFGPNREICLLHHHLSHRNSTRSWRIATLTGASTSCRNLVCFCWSSTETQLCTQCICYVHMYSAKIANYLRIHQISTCTIGSHTGGDDQYDIRFAIARGTLLRKPIDFRGE